MPRLRKNVKGEEGGDFIKKIIEQRIADISIMLEKIKKELDTAPKGSLKIEQRSGKVYFYQQMKEKNTCVRKYLDKKKEKLVKALARKTYYAKIRPLLEKELKALKQFEHSYEPELVDEIYESMSNVRKQLVVPIRLTSNEILRMWENEEYEPYEKYKEKLIYETDHEELVRSKSELIIANLLNRNCGCIRYKYEKPLELTSEGSVCVIHPDFTIININTGKITYWEHAGRMDDPGYADYHVRKMNLYIENGLLPGKDVIVTYETTGCPLHINSVKAYIEKIVEEN